MSLLKEEKGDTTIKTVAVTGGTADAEGTVFFKLVVSTAFNQWATQKRYSQFEEFHNNVLVEMNGKALPAGAELPPKKIKLFTSHSSPEFIEERRVLLESYLKKILSVDKLAKSEVVAKFLSSDKGEEKKKVVDEDAEITGITIPATRTMSDHVLYQVDVVNSKKRKTFSKWTVLKRFGQFYEMDAAVRASLESKPDVLNSLPAAPERKTKLFHDHLDENFVEQRRVLLENYLNRMLDNAVVLRNKHFLTFLGVTVGDADESAD